MANNVEPIDVSAEAWREYVYDDGTSFRVEDPVTLYIVNGSHRVVDTDGVTHRPERGYVGIRWVQNDGQPFSF